MDCDPSTILESATSAGYMQLSPQQQQGALTWLMCQWANTGGGGGGSQEVFCGNYGGSTPTATPTGSCAVAFDTSTGTQWNYWGGSWK